MEEWRFLRFSRSPLLLPALCGVRKCGGSPDDWPFIGSLQLALWGVQAAVVIICFILRQLALWGVQGVMVIIWLDFM